MQPTGLGSHPVDNIRGSLSHHLEGRRIVLAVCGSIAAVKAVELARELIRHGADVVPVMSSSATRILHPDALQFATGHAPILRLTGAVEHVALLGDVPGKADLLLVAPATANTVSKMAMGIDDGPVTTCATVAFGTRTPLVVAPAMHDAMLGHPLVSQHAETLRSRLGVTWVEPMREEKKAKLADVEGIVEAVIHRLANTSGRSGKDTGPGPLAGRRALVISGSTAEAIDPVRVITNRSSGRSGILIATELRRLGAEVTLWQGHASMEVPGHLAHQVVRFSSHADLLRLAKAADLSGYHQVWMPAAVGDYAAEPAKDKIASGKPHLTLKLTPLPKVVEAVRAAAPAAVLVAFKAESDPKALARQAKDRLKRYGAQFVVANASDAFGSEETEVLLVHRKGSYALKGPKSEVLPTVVDLVSMAATSSAATSRPHAETRGKRGKESVRSAPSASKKGSVPAKTGKKGGK
ncbi:MAG TPA: bifunctional phosphopantothenoylcysteine decarboxylase/phosphopantothenate--cysteine ligase CoaBC [Candidatus Thermoplasmatota archaeon]|nr:bifunctional phosphopantothenoylcysteine decarboxylase/phosphopantothenate--cysteine ligase CoaBC [Candidatus Thermoplasmatota archaeon]